MIHPKATNQSAPAARKNKSAARIRPWINCPKPGKKKLQRAAITFPAVPRPVLMMGYPHANHPSAQAIPACSASRRPVPEEVFQADFVDAGCRLLAARPAGGSDHFVDLDRLVPALRGFEQADGGEPGLVKSEERARGEFAVLDDIVVGGHRGFRVAEVFVGGADPGESLVAPCR